MIHDRITDSIDQVGFSLSKTVDSLKIQHQIDKLISKIDSQNSIATEVNAFYDSAWLKLIIVITILGIVLPILIQYFQRNNYKELAENLKSSFDNKLDILKEKNEMQINKIAEEYKHNLKLLESKTDMIVYELDSGLYYLQGRSLMLEKEYISAVYSYFKSIILLKKCNRIDRIIPSLNNLKLAFIKLKSDDIETLDKTLERTFDNKNLAMLLDEIDIDISLDSTVLIITSELRKLYFERNNKTDESN